MWDTQNVQTTHMAGHMFAELENLMEVPVLFFANTYW